MQIRPGHEVLTLSATGYFAAAALGIALIGAAALGGRSRRRDRLGSSQQRQPKVRTIGVDFPTRVVHGTTAKSAKAFVEGRDLPARERSRTLSEFGPDVIYTAEKTAPHQALMFGTHGGRVVLELVLQPGRGILDLASEMQRRPPIGNKVPLAFRGRPSITDDMITWINEARERRGIKPLPHKKASSFLDPTDAAFWGGEYAPLLASYTRDRGYAGMRFTDETVIVDRNAIIGARRMKKHEVEALKRTPRRMAPTNPGALFTKDFEGCVLKRQEKIDG